MLTVQKASTLWDEAVRLYGMLHEAAFATEIGDFETAGKTLYEAMELLWKGKLNLIGDWITMKQVRKAVETAYVQLDYAGKEATLSSLNEAMRALRRARKILATIVQGGDQS